MNNRKSILAVVLLMAGTLLTTTAVTTMVPAAYAGGDNDDDSGDGNKNEAEDDSSAGIADCDRNDVEEARFLCFAIAANDVEIEESEETTTLSVCKERGDNSLGFEPSDFSFTVTGNSPSPAQFFGDNSDGCVDVTIDPGEYAVTESNVFGGGALVGVRIEGECMQDPNNRLRATGEIQAGDTQECTFINTISD